MYLDWAILQYSFRRQEMIDKIKENWEQILLTLKEEHEISISPTVPGWNRLSRILLRITQ